MTQRKDNIMNIIEDLHTFVFHFTVPEFRCVLDYASRDAKRPNIHGVALYKTGVASTDGCAMVYCNTSGSPRFTEEDLIAQVEADRLREAVDFAKNKDIVRLEVTEGDVVLVLLRGKRELLRWECPPAELVPLHSYTKEVTADRSEATPKFSMASKYLARLGAVGDAIGQVVVNITTPSGPLEPVVARLEGDECDWFVITMPMRA